MSGESRLSTALLASIAHDEVGRHLSKILLGMPTLGGVNDVETKDKLSVGIVHTLHNLEKVPCTAFGLVDEDL